MTKTIQFTKNIDLSEKLANYIADNPSEFKEYSVNVSFVTFSNSDEELNKANENLLESLKEEGKEVIKAQETNDKNNPWKFIMI